jgi:hypothetical protein
MSFGWLLDDLKIKKVDVPKTIIYCRSIKAVSLIYKFFSKALGDDMYVGNKKSVRSCLIAMFHRSTCERNKKCVQEILPTKDSAIRVVICTVAFGLGMDIPDIHMVIHWAAPRTFEAFFQESGRAGRDVSSQPCAYSVLYYHNIDVSEQASDDIMRIYAKNMDKCRRELIVDHFTPNMPIVQDRPLHACCDICRQKCKCSACPPIPATPTEPMFDFALSALSLSVGEDVREVSHLQRSQVASAITSYRDSFQTGISFVNADIVTGLDDTVIENIVSSVHHIHQVEDLLDEYLYDSKVATRVMSIISDIF